MQKAERIVQAMRKLGEKRLPLTRVYRNLYSEELFLAAYAKISRNQGALTPGTDNDTVDGMNLARIYTIIEALRHERFRFRPSRRIHIPKKSGGQRPLCLPNFSDKLVQEVLRTLLEAYYEPRFRDSSHGFRPGRGCHTALTRIKESFRGSAWLIEGDIRGCFDRIDRDVLMAILARDIEDTRLLKLIRQSLDAGVLEDWRYEQTYSGTPQGGILSPLLANIYLHELDTFVEDTLIPQYTRGERRAVHLEYKRYEYQIRCARERGDHEAAKTLIQERRQFPSQDTHDPDYRRLRYIRYADDFLLGFIGSKSEAEEIKAAIKAFLWDKLGLEMSAEKTLITHARTQQARFLGYAISIYDADDKLTPSTRDPRIKRRSINGHVRLGIPTTLAKDLAKRYQRNGKVISESALLAHSDAYIIYIYQQRFRGLAEYYKYAVDRCHLASLKQVMQISLVKTLAHKHRISASQVYQKFRGTRVVDGFQYKTLQVEVPTKNGKRLIYWGAIPLKAVKPDNQPLNHIRKPDSWMGSRTDLIKRLQADACELCGSRERIEVHHIHKLANLKKPGQKEKPAWQKRMIAMRRKTLVVCHKCHVSIHAGRPVPQRRT